MHFGGKTAVFRVCYVAPPIATEIVKAPFSPVISHIAIPRDTCPVKLQPLNLELRSGVLKIVARPRVVSSH